MSEAYEPRLKTRYRDEVRAKMREQFSYTNEMQIPKVEKVVINMGVGEAAQDRKKLQAAAADMTAIAGQKPLITKSRKSIANFKLRENLAIGCKVTLRRERMYEFLDRLVSVALPVLLAESMAMAIDQCCARRKRCVAGSLSWQAKQAVAIGISKARKKGARVPAKA